MITVHVRIPILEKSYDVKIDENMSVYQIQKEITDLACMDLQCPLPEDYASILLWDAKSQRPLRRELTAWENDIVSGSELILS